jgi:hypothetical protein
MLSKLLKKDLNKNMRWMWILFVSTILVAAVTRGFKELGENIAFFKVLGIFFDSVFYTLAVNVILHPFLRNFLNFSKSFYGDESYLTHTLPVTKNQLITSKFLTAIIEISLGFITLVSALLIMFASPTMLTTLKLLLSTLITGNFSVVLVLIAFVLLVIVEFLMFISLIFLATIISYRAKENRSLRTFLLTAGMSLIAISILAVFLIAVLAINNVKLNTTTLVLSSTAFFSVIITGIVVYMAIVTLCYFVAKKEFNKGVNVD